MADKSKAVPDFDGVSLAKQLLRRVRSGALATIDRDTGFPFASLVTIGTDFDGSPLCLMSRLSAHTLNLERDPRASIMLAEIGRGDPLAHPRLTVTGTMARTEDRYVRSRFLARHPKAKLYVDFADFSFWRLTIVGGHLNGGFARAASLTAEALRTDVSHADDLIRHEESILDDLNRPPKDDLRLLAETAAGQPSADWQATGVDPEGIDLMAGDLTARVEFPGCVENPSALRRALAALRTRASPAKGSAEA